MHDLKSRAGYIGDGSAPTSQLLFVYEEKVRVSYFSDHNSNKNSEVIYL